MRRLRPRGLSLVAAVGRKQPCAATSHHQLRISTGYDQKYLTLESHLMVPVQYGSPGRVCKLVRHNAVPKGMTQWVPGMVDGTTVCPLL